MDKKYPNSGVLFAALAKKSPKAPDYVGIFYLDLSTVQIVDGHVEFKIGGWKKTSKNGKTFLALAVDNYKKEERQERHSEPDDADIPF
jgi:hypothetical protein